jgi:hypothetical protein
VALQAIIDRVQVHVASLSGMRSAPDDPIESPNVFPFGTTFAGSGVWENGNIGKVLTQASHDITTVIVVARKDLPRDIQKSAGYADAFQAALQTDPDLNGNVSIIESLNYTFGPIEWAGLLCIGYTFSMTVTDINC